MAEPNIPETAAKPPSPLRELIDPFINLAKAPRALWAVNLAYLLEGLCYFGILTLLGLFFNDYAKLDDVHAGWILSAFTGGITLAMFFFGELADRWGVRAALLLSLLLMVVGRVLLTSSPFFGGSGMFSPVMLAAVGGLLLVVIGYGMFQPAAYAAVRMFTNEKTAPMGYAMLYGLMNLGGFMSGIMSPPIRGSFGITGIYWVYAAITAAGLVAVFILLTKGAAQKAKEGASGVDAKVTAQGIPMEAIKAPFHLLTWLKTHPLADLKFSFFIFALIPVQTLFAHQWMTMPQYVARAYPGWVSNHMETFVNLNALLIFVLTPIVTALTSKVKVYRMMVLGTLVMALPTFFLVIGPHIVPLFAYIIFLSIGEAMWSPRFYQLAAEIAPEGKTGQYMGIAQFPWFLTKMLTGLYSGAMLRAYCPADAPQNTEMLWLIYGCIALATPLGLWLARNWMGNRLQKSGH